jgi:hypothetical protein
VSFEMTVLELESTPTSAKPASNDAAIDAIAHDAPGQSSTSPAPSSEKVKPARRGKVKKKGYRGYYGSARDHVA